VRDPKKVLLIIFFAVIIFTACNSSSVKFTSVDEFVKWLSAQPDNTADTSYSVKLKVSNISGVNDVLKKNENKFLSLDLSGSSLVSGSSFAYVEEDSFKDCTSLTNIILPNSVTSIGRVNLSAFGAFQGCTNLASITIPNSVTKIGECTFDACISLTSITIPNSVTEIGSFAFFSCTSLTSVTIPDSVSSIGVGVFDSCTSLTSLIIPDSVTEVLHSTFRNCNSLTNITIPKSITFIDDVAFSNCTRLTSVTFAGTISSDSFLDYDTFPGDLRDKFYATDKTNGTPGTYTREIDGSVWTRK